MIERKGLSVLTILIITNRNTTLGLSNPTDPVTPNNLPFQSRRQPDRLALASARRGLRRRHRLPGAAQHPGDGAVLFLTNVNSQLPTSASQ